MKYICENDHIFEHTAKLHARSSDEISSVEVPVCPICETRTYTEYVLDKKRIVSVVSVDLSEVDAKLKEGYEVDSLYAKTATLVKREKD